MKAKKILSYVAAASLSVLLLAGCGESQNPPAAGNENSASSNVSEESSGEEGKKAEESPEAGAASAKSGTADSLLGEWQYMCTLYRSEGEDEEPYEYVNMCTDDMAAESTVVVRKDGDTYKADYMFQEYEYNCMIYGAELKLVEEAPFEGAETSWYLSMEDPFIDDSNTGSDYRFYLESDDTLGIATLFSSAPEDEYQYHSINKNLYLAKGSPRFDDAEELRYFDTVTVSSAEELLNSLQNNRKIIVEAGTYNFSKVDESKVTNRKVTNSYGAFNIEGVYNLGIEAKEGADVQFCIDEAYDPVMNFNECGNLTFRGLTCGHTVEPGYCSGSVLCFDNVNSIDIDRCKLYGSGTYGVEASYCGRINVKDSDIYECTYGLVDLRYVSSAYFTNCSMRDSSELSMIDIYSCYDVVFEGCTFSGNRADAYDTCYFVELGEYDSATFRNCAFNDNKFYTFSNKEVTLENCTSDNNEAGFSDILKASRSGGVPDKSTILTTYETAKKRAEEIDNRFQSDALMDQQTMNKLSYEEFNLWDGLLNQIWTYLKENLDEEKMTALTEEQQKWIREKEASMKESGADFEGGSMQPMIEYGTGATLTQKRVEELMNQYIND